MPRDRVIGNPNSRSHATKLCVSGERYASALDTHLESLEKLVMEGTGVSVYPAGYVDVDLE
jgi:hypothetical protein